MGSYRATAPAAGSPAPTEPASFSDGEGTVSRSRRRGTGATPEGQYLGLWLHMPKPRTPARAMKLNSPASQRIPQKRRSRPLQVGFRHADRARLGLLGCLAPESEP